MAAATALQRRLQRATPHAVKGCSRKDSKAQRLSLGRLQGRKQSARGRKMRKVGPTWLQAAWTQATALMPLLVCQGPAAPFGAALVALRL